MYQFTASVLAKKQLFCKLKHRLVCRSLRMCCFVRWLFILSFYSNCKITTDASFFGLLVTFVYPQSCTYILYIGFLLNCCFSRLYPFLNTYKRFQLFALSNSTLLKILGWLSYAANLFYVTWFMANKHNNSCAKIKSYCGLLFSFLVVGGVTSCCPLAAARFYRVVFNSYNTR